MTTTGQTGRHFAANVIHPSQGREYVCVTFFFFFFNWQYDAACNNRSLCNWAHHGRRPCAGPDVIVWRYRAFCLHHFDT